jgi:hypothetical protein
VARSVWTVVLNWNGREDTAACLESLRAVRVPADVSWTRLVVDNGSSDGSLETLPQRFPRCASTAPDRTCAGRAGTMPGLALAQRKAPTACSCSTTTRCSNPTASRACSRRSSGIRKGGLFGPTILLWDGRTIWSAGGEFWPALGWGAHRKLGQAFDPRTLAGDAQPCGYLTGAALYVTRACLERVGRLDEGYYLYGEDADYALRARALGFAACGCPPRDAHKVSGSSGAASPFKAYHRTRAGMRIGFEARAGVSRARPGRSRFRSAARAERGVGRARRGMEGVRGGLARVGGSLGGVPPGTSGYVPKREAA